MVSPSTEDRLPPLEIGPDSLDTGQPIIFYEDTIHGQWLNWEAEREGYFQLKQVDESQNQLIYKVNSLPDGAHFDSASKVFTWNPSNFQVGKEHIVDFTVTNGLRTSNRQVIITVKKDKEKNIGSMSNRHQNAREIARVISDARTNLPLIIGMYNHSGEGRSSFMDLIGSKLEDINTSKEPLIVHQCTKTHVVRFDASEYDDQDKIWLSMLNELFGKFEDEEGFPGRVKYSLKLIRKVGGKNREAIILSLILLAIFIFFSFRFFNYTGNQGTSISDSLLNPLYIFIAGLISIAPVVKKIFIPAMKKTHTHFVKPLYSEISKNAVYPDFKSRLGTREEVKESLNTLINLWVKKKNERIVIMVDHLDLCTEDTIVEFFDALQLFSSNKDYEPISFVMPFNPDLISMALAKKTLFSLDETEITKEEKLRLGKNYLESIITFPYKMPKANDYSKFIDSLLPDLSTNPSLRRIIEKKPDEHEDRFLFDKEDRELLKYLISEISLYANLLPSDVKKIVNLLLFSKEKWKSVSSNKRDEDKVKYKDFKLTKFQKQYISWFLFECFNPSLAKRTINNLEKHKAKYANQTFESFLKDFPLENLKKEDNKKLDLNIFFKDINSLVLNDLHLEYIFVSHEIIKDLLPPNLEL